MGDEPKKDIEMTGILVDKDEETKLVWPTVLDDRIKNPELRERLGQVPFAQLTYAQWRLLFADSENNFDWNDIDEPFWTEYYKMLERTTFFELIQADIDMTHDCRVNFYSDNKYFDTSHATGQIYGNRSELLNRQPFKEIMAQIDDGKKYTDDRFEEINNELKKATKAIALMWTVLASFIKSVPNGELIADLLEDKLKSL